MRMPIALRAAPERVERALELLGWCRDRDVPTALWETSPKALIATPISLMERARHLFCADPDAVPHLAGQLEGRRPLVLPLAAQSIPERVASFGERAPDVAFLWPWDMTGEHLHHERMRETFDVAARYGVVILNPTPGSPPPGLPRRMRPSSLPCPAIGVRWRSFSATESWSPSIPAPPAA